jgi:hypothetical protein
VICPKASRIAFTNSAHMGAFSWFVVVLDFVD